MRVLAPKELELNLKTLLVLNKRVFEITHTHIHSTYVSTGRGHARVLAPKELEPNLKTLLEVNKRLSSPCHPGRCQCHLGFWPRPGSLRRIRGS